MAALEPSGPLLVQEQRNLFGGIDLVLPGARGRARRVVAVDGRFKVGFAAALALVVEHGKQAEAEAAVPTVTRCPRCQKVDKTGKAFGTRLLRGRRVPQSWCRECRAAHLEAEAPEQEDWLLPHPS